MWRRMQARYWWRRWHGARGSGSSSSSGFGSGSGFGFGASRLAAKAAITTTTVVWAARLAIPLSDSDSSNAIPPNIASSAPPPGLAEADALAELSKRVKAIRKEHDAATASWPSLNWRSIANEGCVEIWWNLPAGFDTSVLVDSMLDELGGELSISRVPQACSAPQTHGRRLSANTSNSVLICDSSTSTQLLVQKCGRRPRLLLRKYGRWREADIRAIAGAYRASALPVVQAADNLSRLGIRIFNSDKDLSWSDLGGYEELKSEVQNNVILALEHPSFFDEIAAVTRAKPCSNRPKAILFEGAPGTGKTTIARIIASSINVPLIVIPLEAVLSKWYGESEKMMASIFDAIDEMGDAVVFIDEIDSIASSRSGGESHETSRRMLSVLLQRIEGIDGPRQSILIGATNRKQDLDAAMLSRFDSVITFPDPDVDARFAIFRLYAKHLSEQQLTELSELSEGMSGRDIKDLCGQAERSWAGELLRTKGEACAPPLHAYLDAVHRRAKGQRVAGANRSAAAIRTLGSILGQ